MNTFKYIQFFTLSILMNLISGSLMSQNIFALFEKKNLVKFNSVLAKKPDLVNLLNYEGSSVLHLAARNNSFAFIKAALNYGASINLQDSSGCTALMYAVRNGNLENSQYLFSKGGDLEIRDHGGRTAIFYSLENSQVFEWIINSGADINVRKNDSTTFLMYTILYGTPDMVLYLLNHNVNVNEQDFLFKTALHDAVLIGNIHVVEALIQKGAGIDKTDMDGISPLMSACSLGDLDIIKYLCIEGADICMTDHFGNDALCYATKSRKLVCIKWIIEYALEKGINCIRMGEALKIAVYYNDIVPTEFLLKNGADPNYKDKEELTPLMYLFISPESASSDKEYSILLNGETLIDLMLKYGVNLNAHDGDGYTTLMYCAMNGFITLADYLIGKGANPNLRNKDGLTAEELAKIYGLKKTKRVVREVPTFK